jgi:hypothetical protein
MDIFVILKSIGKKSNKLCPEKEENKTEERQFAIYYTITFCATNIITMGRKKNRYLSCCLPYSSSESPHPW